jgi:hypothetical protein
MDARTYIINSLQIATSYSLPATMAVTHRLMNHVVEYPQPTTDDVFKLPPHFCRIPLQALNADPLLPSSIYFSPAPESPGSSGAEH